MKNDTEADRSIIRKRRFFSPLFAVIVFLVLITVAQAAPGDLDSTFGSGGKALSDVTIYSSETLVQPDGKIIVAGGDGSGGGIIARFNPNGQFDSTFGAGGKIRAYRYIFDIALQSDGKIVAVVSQSQNLTTVRYNSNGTLDSTFGTGGIVSTQVVTDGEAVAVAVQSDGKILVGGGSRLAKTGRALLYRYNSNGTTDTTFANNGSYQIGSVSGARVSEILIQPDGKIVMVAIGGIYRLNSNGTPDTAFGSSNNGIASTGIANTKLALQPDGKIVAAGRDFNTNKFALARLNANGILDSGFGVNGVAQLSIGILGSDATDVEIQKNGKIVAVGSKIDTQGNLEAIVARFMANGAPDTNFGGGGVLSIFQTPANSATALALQQDGKIVVAAVFQNVVLVRYLGDAVNSISRFDFDGDARADVSVVRPSTSVWYFLNSLNGFGAVQFGVGADQIAAADFDGDRKTDIAVFRPSNGEWTILRSSNNSYQIVNFGGNGDLPRPVDFDGDGRADITVFRPSNGVWYWLNSSDGQFRFAAFGQNGDAPLIADFDGDGKSDLAVYRPSNGVWYWIQSFDQSFKGLAFGATGDVPVPADYDGDGKTDVAVFRPSNGTWYLQQSLLGFTGTAFGASGDKPVAADYDGDGRADVSVFRPSNGVWYFLQSASGFSAVQFGAGNDKPIPFAFAP